MGFKGEGLLLGGHKRPVGKKRKEEEMEGGGAGSSSSSSSSSSSNSRAKVDVMKEIRSHEVALAELNYSLTKTSSTPSVYQKNGNVYFRTTIDKAVASEQKQLDSTKAMLEKLN